MRLLYYALRYNGDYNKINNAILNNEPYERVDYNGKYITIEDKNYPEILKQLANPPYVLFYHGNIDLLKRKIICVIGSRNASLEGKKLTQQITMHNCLFISGLAKGIDGYVHQYAKQSIGVIGCGINRIYPKENKLLYGKTDLIISEYPNDVKPYRHHFPMRNRIMVALCEKLIVVEGKINSGTMLSVNLALSLGKEIYVFPTSFFSEYNLNNLLIKEGAFVINDAETLKEIVSEL